jgi:hypothetical protein
MREGSCQDVHNWTAAALTFRYIPSMRSQAHRLQKPGRCPACRSRRVRTAPISPNVGVHAVCDACGVAWLETPDKRAVPLRPSTYPGGLALVPAPPDRSRIVTLWTLGDWRCEREGLTVRLYRREYLANALTVPDDQHVRECATQWLAAVPSPRRPSASKRPVSKKR